MANHKIAVTDGGGALEIRCPSISPVVVDPNLPASSVVFV